MAAKRVVIVDDERDIVDIVSELLRGEGYETILAYDGKDGWEAISRDKPDAVVLDIKMPGLTGIEVIQLMRKDAKLAATPIVVITATQVIRESEQRFKDLKVYKWISKPFEPEELISTVTRAMQKNG